MEEMTLSAIMFSPFSKVTDSTFPFSVLMEVTPDPIRSSPPRCLNFSSTILSKRMKIHLSSVSAPGTRLLIGGTNVSFIATESDITKFNSSDSSFTSSNSSSSLTTRE